MTMVPEIRIAQWPAPAITMPPSTGVGVLVSGALAGGSHSSNAPHMGVDNAPGSMVAGFWKLCLADRILAKPLRVQFGVVSQPTQKTVSLWNTHAFNVTLMSSGITAHGVTSDMPVNSVLGAMLDRDVALTAALEGAAQINGVLEMLWSSGHVTNIIIEGLRGLVFAYRPDEGYEELDEFSTNIFDSLNGSEYRESYISVAKKNFAYTVRAVSEQQFAEIQNKLHAAARVPLIQPVWSSETKLLQPTTGIPTIYINTVESDFQAGDILLFYVSETIFDVRQITAVNSGNITLATAPEINFPAGTMVLPARICYLASSTQYSLLYNHMGAWTKFDIKAEQV